MNTPGFTVTVHRDKLQSLLMERLRRLQILRDESRERELELEKAGAARLHAPGCDADKISEGYNTAIESLARIAGLISCDQRDRYQLTRRDMVTLDLAVASTHDPAFADGASAFVVTVDRDKLVSMIRNRSGRLEELRAEALQREARMVALHGPPPHGIQLKSALLEAQGKSLVILVDLVESDAKKAYDLSLDDLIALDLIASTTAGLLPGHY